MVIDFFNDKCMNLWAKGLNDLYKQVPFDGLWLDMNEPTALIAGELQPDDAQPLTPEERLRTKRFLEEEDYSWYSTFD